MKKREMYQIKGVDALFGEVDLAPIEGQRQTLPIAQIKLPPLQPRRYFDPDKMQQLTVSVRQHGVLENLLVRPLTAGFYELVAGERRLRAAQAAGLDEVPVVIQELNDQQAFEIALIENLQREDLNPVEETEGILQLLSKRLNQPVEEVISLLYQMANDHKGNSNHNVVVSDNGAQINLLFEELGRLSWQSFVAHRLPLLKLPGNVLEVLRQGKLAYTKAQAIARVKDEHQRQCLLEIAVNQNFSLNEIRNHILQLNQSMVASSSPAGEALSALRSRFDQTYHRAKKSAVWNDPKKAKKLENLLTQLEALID